MSVSPSRSESSKTRMGEPVARAFETSLNGNRLSFIDILIPRGSLTLVVALNNCVYTQK